jgi:hypothetical protein
MLRHRPPRSSLPAGTATVFREGTQAFFEMKTTSAGPVGAAAINDPTATALRAKIAVL